MAETIIVVLYVIAEFAALLTFVWGWARWIRHWKVQTFFGALSLLGFFLASASALLAIAGVLYARAIGGFPYYDRRLLRILGVGGLLSIAALVFAACGARRANPLRWHALGCAFATLLFWFMTAAGE